MNRREAAFLYFLEINDKTFEELANAGDFVSLDGKLGQAISSVADGQFQMKMSVKAEEMAKNRQNITGRQRVKMIFEHNKRDEENGFRFDIHDICGVAWMGDSGASRFQDLVPHGQRIKR